MKTYRQIIYRQSDTALMIMPSDISEIVEIRFVKDLSDDKKLAFLELQKFLLTQIDNLDYCVYTTENDSLDAQPSEKEVKCMVVSELDTDNKLVVTKVLDICSELLNN